MQDLAAAAGVPLVPVGASDGWHRGCGNGMVVANCGMALLAILASLVPKPELQASVWKHTSIPCFTFCLKQNP